MRNRRATKSTLILALIFFIVLGVLTVLVIRNLSQQQQERTGAGITDGVSPAITQQASVRLLPVGGRTVFGANEEVRVWAVAESQGKEIKGYDLVLTYDPSRLLYVSAQGSLAQFDAFSQQKNGMVFLTAVKQPQASASSIFNETIVGEFVFRALSAGPTKLQYAFTPGSTTDTNLLTDQAKEVLTTVYPLTVSIGNTLQLVQDVPVLLDDKQTSVVLSDVEPLKANCADCLESATVKVEQNGREKMLEFKAGGIAGFTELSREAFGYIFEVAKFNQVSIDLVVGKK